MVVEVRKVDYRAAGVDIDAAERAVADYRKIAATDRPEVLKPLGSFAGLFKLNGYKEPVLVSSTDGVGSKSVIAGTLGRFDTIGQDLVNHSINDIITAGAEPLFIQDFIGSADLPYADRVTIVAGIGAACRENGIALLGGETADMPDVYRSGDFELAAFIVGVVEEAGLILADESVKPDDVLLAWPSRGLMTNGYSLVREIWRIGKGTTPNRAKDKALLEEYVDELGESLGDALLRVHPSFYADLQPHLPLFHGLAHVTGGGIEGNVRRWFDEGSAISAHIDCSTWDPPAIFSLIQSKGGVTDAEMWRVFNMGVGMVAAVSADDVDAVMAGSPDAWVVGRIRERKTDSLVTGLPS